MLKEQKKGVKRILVEYLGNLMGVNNHGKSKVTYMGLREDGKKII